MTLQTPWLLRQLKRLHRDYQSQAAVNPAADAFWEGYNLALVQVQRAVEAKERRERRHAEALARGFDPKEARAFLAASRSRRGVLLQFAVEVRTRLEGALDRIEELEAELAAVEQRLDNLRSDL